MQRRLHATEHVVEAPHSSRTRRTTLEYEKQRRNAYEADNDDETETKANPSRRVPPAEGYEASSSRRQPPLTAAGNRTARNRFFDEVAKHHGSGSHSDHGSSSHSRGGGRGRGLGFEQSNRSNNSSRSRVNGNGLRSDNARAPQDNDYYTSAPRKNGRAHLSAEGGMKASGSSISASSSRTGSKSNRISTDSSVASSNARLNVKSVILPIVPADYAQHPLKAALWMILQLCDQFREKQQQRSGLYQFLLTERGEATTKRQYILKEAATVLACDPFKRGKALEQKLWHEILYPCIQVLKSAILSSLSSSSQNQQSLLELFEAYEMAITDAQKFYTRVLANVFSLYTNKSSLNCMSQLNIGIDLSKLNVVGSAVHSSQANKKDEFLRDIMHRCLIFLGDLSRYWCLIYPNDWFIPQHYYSIAHQLNVNNGRPFNQLGKACADASNSSNSLNATYFYVRAIGTTLDNSSTTGADKNLKAFLKHALAPFSGVFDKDGVVYIAKINKSAYLQEMWVNIQLVLYSIMFCGNESVDVKNAAADGDAKKSSSSSSALPSTSFFKRACESIVEDFSHAFAHCISTSTNSTGGAQQKPGRKISACSSENDKTASSVNSFELDAEHVWKLLIIVIECVDQAGRRLTKCSIAAGDDGGAGDASRAGNVAASSAEFWIEVVAHVYSLVFALFERVCDAIDQQLATAASDIAEIYRVLNFALTSSASSGMLQLLPVSKHLTTSPANLRYFLTTEEVFSDSEAENDDENNKKQSSKFQGGSSTANGGHQRRRRMQASDSEDEFPALPGTIVSAMTLQHDAAATTSKKDPNTVYPPAYHQLMQTNAWTFDAAIATLYDDDDEEAAGNAGSSSAEQVMAMTDFLPYQLRIEDDDDDEAAVQQQQAKAGEAFHRKLPMAPAEQVLPAHTPKPDANNSGVTPVQLILRQWHDFSNFELPEPPPDNFSLDAVDFTGGKKANENGHDREEQLWLYITNQLAYKLDHAEYLPCVRLFAAWILSKRETVEVCHHNYSRMLELLASIGNAVAMPRAVLKELMQLIEPLKVSEESEGLFNNNEDSAVLNDERRAVLLADEAHLLGFGALSSLDRLAGVTQNNSVVAGLASVDVVDLATRPAYQLVSMYRLSKYCEQLHRTETVFEDIHSVTQRNINKINPNSTAYDDRPVYRVREPGATEVDIAKQLAVAQSAAAEQERKRATMQKMATVWMQDVQRKVDDELAEEMRQHYERDRPDIPVYLVFDTSCFLEHLPIVNDLLQTRMFHCCVPFAVIDELDMLKQTSKAARDAVRFIDAQGRQQNQLSAGDQQQQPALLRLQAWSETLSGKKHEDNHEAVWKQNHDATADGSKTTKNQRFVADVAECCEYFYAEASSRLVEGGGRDDERELLTLLTAHDDAVSTYAALYRRQLQVLKQKDTSGKSLSVTVEHILRLNERSRVPYNTNWKTHRLPLAS